MVAMPDSDTSGREFIRGVIADAAVAFIASVVITLIVASLAAAGLITMGLAVVLLVLAWVVAVIGSFFLPWPIPHKHRGVFAGFLAVLLALMGWYEAEHYEKPPSSKEIADEVVSLLGGMPTLKPPASDPSTEVPFPSLDPLASKVSKIMYLCHAPADKITKQTPLQLAETKKQFSDLLEGMLDTTVEINEIPSGYRYVFTSKTPNKPKVTYEIRRYRDDLYVIITLNVLPPELREYIYVWGDVIPANDPGIKKMTALIAHQVGAEPGKCRLL
jgi:hypothetical protein